MLFTGEINRKTFKTETVQLQCSVTPPSKPLIHYKTYLQSYYEKDPIACDDKLGIAPSSEFINLALVGHDGSTYRHGASFSGSTEGVSEESLGLDSIVTPDSRFVLVEGDAGMGKSTLCWELCRKWDDLKSLQYYKIVVLQKLREMRLQKATTLNEIFHHDNPALSKGVVDEMYRCEGEGVLLILDGFDEMPAKLIRDKESLIMRVISGACLPKATRLVTSRPSAIQCKGYGFPQEYRYIKTRGFTDESIERFAEKAFARSSEVLEHFKNFILSNPIIKSMMNIPVNCAILAQVYKDIMKSSKLMPKTMTQLYTTLVLVLIRRHMIERGEWDKGKRVPVNLNDLPSEVTAALKRISELAYKSLFKEKSQLVFTDDEVGEGFKHLGLLSEAKEMYVSEGARSTYSFSHKSIQEFLAACCVAHHSDMIGEPAAHVNGVKTWKHKAFTLFLCGMVGTGGLYGLSLWDQRNYICRCLYEAQDHDNSLLPLEIVCILTTPLDAYTLGYCLTHLNLQFEVESIDTSLKPLLSCLRNHTGTLLGSIKHLPLNDSLQSITVRDQFKSLIEIFNSKGRPISGIGIDITANDDREWLSELIPTLHLITHLSLSFHLVGKLDLLKRYTKRFAQNLCNVISSVNLKEVTLKSHKEPRDIGFIEEVISYSFNVIEPFVSIVEAVMSSPTINKLTTNFAFQVFKNRNIQDIVFDVQYRYYDTAATCSSALSIRRILMSLWYCIEKIHESGFILPLKSVTLRIRGVIDRMTEKGYVLYRFQYPMYNFLAIVNKYLLQCCTYNRTQLIVEDISCCKMLWYPLCCTLNGLGRALRREPYLSSCALKKSQSLGDLRTVPSLVEIKPFSGNNSQSCPDLLELEALTNLHPKLRKFAGILEPSQLNLDGGRHHSRLVLPFPSFLIRPAAIRGQNMHFAVTAHYEWVRL